MGKIAKIIKEEIFYIGCDNCQHCQRKVNDEYYDGCDGCYMCDENEWELYDVIAENIERKWLDTFNTESATSCFTAVQELKNSLHL